MLKMVLVRHGQTEWNAELRNQGHMDIPLDEVGRQQSRKLAESFRACTFDAIFCSDMSRTKETAKAIAEVTSSKTVIEDPRLRERNYGHWEGKTREEIAVKEAGHLEKYRSDPAFYAPTGGETGIEVYARCLSFLWEVLQKYPEGHILVVSHGGTIANLVAALIGGSPATASCFRIMNASITEIEILENKRRVLLRYNDVSHLDSKPLQSMMRG